MRDQIIVPILSIVIYHSQYSQKISFGNTTSGILQLVTPDKTLAAISQQFPKENIYPWGELGTDILGTYLFDTIDRHGYRMKHIRRNPYKKTSFVFRLSTQDSCDRFYSTLDDIHSILPQKIDISDSMRVIVPDSYVNILPLLIKNIEIDKKRIQIIHDSDGSMPTLEWRERQ